MRTKSNPPVKTQFRLTLISKPGGLESGWRWLWEWWRGVDRSSCGGSFPAVIIQSISHLFVILQYVRDLDDDQGNQGGGSEQQSKIPQSSKVDFKEKDRLNNGLNYNMWAIIGCRVSSVKLGCGSTSLEPGRDPLQQIHLTQIKLHLNKRSKTQGTSVHKD